MDWEKDFRDWILLHGWENAAAFPPEREKSIIDYKGPTVEAIEEEWEALRAYFKEEAEALAEARRRIKRAGEVFLWRITHLPESGRKKEEPTAPPPAREPESKREWLF